MKNKREGFWCSHKARISKKIEDLMAKRGVKVLKGDEKKEKREDMWLAQIGQRENHRYASDNSESSLLIHQLGRDISINCLLCCSRSDYGIIATLNTSFHSLIRSGELYKLMRQKGIVQHWVYFSCNLLEWEAFDPTHRRWMHMPKIRANDCFMCSDNESLAVGTELLIFGKEIMYPIVYKYSILTHTWTPGMRMHTPRYLFASASLGEIGIIAGGCDLRGNILSSAELYNSETGKWETIPSMNKARRMCSAVLMEGKFYVIGGIGVENLKIITSGEVYDLKTKTWSEIPNMYPATNEGAVSTKEPFIAEGPPLLAVVNDVLYVADHVLKQVKKYDKEKNLWVIVGRFPKRTASMDGWGITFKACGDQLMVIGGPRVLGAGFVEINSWVPKEGPLEWNLVGRKPSSSFVYNCVVMGC
ncbi:F-box/kelch-repeat protein At1g74510-like [Gossypium raimondii]|uniref:F-box/kelch-repeat protein At1g74510-like n=1 Tax=Gossypium raimondii TaxID=29730 RepID=UPI00063A99BF|nr:F-box/kelch-repeat protein At1g74510-like [Gossypium raimondii]